MSQKRRIAITGVGMVTPVGNDAPATWTSLQAGRSGLGPIQYFDASGFPVRIGAEVKNFTLPQQLMPPAPTPNYVRMHQFALAAAEEALTDAGIRPVPENSHRWGLSTGAGMMCVSFSELQQVHNYVADADGELQTDGFLRPDFAFDPLTFCRTQSNTGLSLLTEQFGIHGYATAVNTACASGGQAIGTALKVLRRGQADFMLAGGFDSMLNPFGVSAFCLLGALSPDNDTPTRASRPFDLTRNGFVLGEGAGYLVLEEWQHALKRGAKIYAELAGDGNSCSSYRITDSPPDGDGPIQAIRQALADANATPEELDYVNAHGTSTQMNDKSECAALNAVLGSGIDRVAVSSTKSCMGHLIAAAGAVEAAVCVLAIRDGVAPVNANHDHPDPACHINVVRGSSRPMKIRLALSNSLGFGGSNSSLVFRNPTEVTL